MTVLMHGPSAASGCAGRRVDVVAGQGHDLDPEDLEHRGRVDVGQAVPDDLVHHEQEGHLQEERQAAGQRADAALLEQLLLGDPRLHGIALESALDLLDLGREAASASS